MALLGLLLSKVGSAGQAERRMDCFLNRFLRWDCTQLKGAGRVKDRMYTDKLRDIQEATVRSAVV